MTYYASDDKRDDPISRLHAIVSLLYDQPGVPAPGWADVLVVPGGGMNDEKRAEIDTFASRIKAEIQKSTSGDYCAVGCRAVEYRTVVIPSSRYPLLVEVIPADRQSGGTAGA